MASFRLNRQIGRQINRRNFLQMTGVTAAAMAGLGSTFRSARAERSDELNIYAWEGYTSDDVLDPFRREFDARVRAEGLISDPDAINKLRAGETEIWDIINLNNPWAREWMYPEGLIKPVDKEVFAPYHEKMLPKFAWPFDWALDKSGEEMLGVCQRFGPFSFVVNTDKISRETAEDEGWNIFLDPAMQDRFGVLTYDNWNIFHMCIAAGFSPFKEHTPEEFAAFERVARQVFNGAKLLSDDLVQMNLALINGEIDAYFTGGTYTASPARYDGATNIRAITPNSGPIDGKGGIVWIELTSLVNNPNPSTLGPTFLEFIQRPEMSKLVAFAEGTYNPVAQMGDPQVMETFDSEELDAIQWDSLEEEMARSVDYDINPDYAEMYPIYAAARRERQG